MISEKIILAGSGGQGVMLIGQLLAYAANDKNLNSLWYPSYGPETRGGTANCSVTISEKQINSPVISKADTVIALNKPSLLKFEKSVKPNGRVIINSSLVDVKVSRNDIEAYYIPANDLAMQLGNIKVANMIILGAYLNLLKIFNEEDILKLLKKMFGEAKADLIDINKKALDLGYQYVSTLVKS